MMEEGQLEKTEFDKALDAIDVPDVEPFHPIYSDDELMGRTDEPESDDPAEPETPEPDDDGCQNMKDV